MHPERTNTGDVPSNNENNSEKDCAKKLTQDGQKERSFAYKSEGNKIQDNPAIHSIKTNDNNSSKKRIRKREKQKKEKRKAIEKEKDYL